MGKKLVLWLLAFGMCFSMFSCSGGSGNSGTNSDSSAGSNVESESTSDSVSDSESASDSESTSDSDSTSDSTSDSEDGGEEDKKEYVTVTFKQAGAEDVVKTVEKGTALTDVPTPAAKTGYTVAWDVTDFANVTENLVVNAVETAKTYTVVYTNADMSQTTYTVTYGQKYAFETPTHEDKTFVEWTYNGETMAMDGVWELDAESGEVILVAKWISDWTGNY